MTQKLPAGQLVVLRISN